jgi:transcriptional regulator with XRE-family HTH domain
MDRHAIGQRMREARDAREITRRRVSEAIGVTERTIAAWEAGDTAPGADDLCAYARAVGTTASRLLR